jgi:hypothetical protein
MSPAGALLAVVHSIVVRTAYGVRGVGEEMRRINQVS